MPVLQLTSRLAKSGGSAGPPCETRFRLLLCCWWYMPNFLLWLLFVSDIPGGLYSTACMYDVGRQMKVLLIYYDQVVASRCCACACVRRLVFVCWLSRASCHGLTTILTNISRSASPQFTPKSAVFSRRLTKPCLTSSASRICHLQSELLENCSDCRCNAPEIHQT